MATSWLNSKSGSPGLQASATVTAMVESAVGQATVKVKYIQSAAWVSLVPGKMARTCIVLERWMKGCDTLGDNRSQYG